MNEFNSWTEINWYALGSLLAQFAFLAAGVWFAHNFLRTIRAFQEQLGALLKLSITGNSPEPQAASANERRSFEAGPYWLAPETHAAGIAQHAASGPSAWHHMIHWLQEPMHSSEVSAWRRAMHWLQAPTGT
jgi:hypothetical protein